MVETVLLLNEKNLMNYSESCHSSKDKAYKTTAQSFFDPGLQSKSIDKVSDQEGLSHQGGP
jgi:hypothetical protein